MFWRVTTFTPLSPIDAILDKEEFTLDELLSEEDIIQECKSANSRLVQYLGQPKVLEQLLWYLTETPEDDLHFKYSYTACEIFCCELDDVLSNLITSDELMERLFSPLDKPPPLNSTLAGYFGRVVGCLLVKRAPDTHKWLAAHPEVLPALVRHVDTTSTVEVILRLVGADEIASAGGPSTASEWLSDTNLMDQLLDTLVAPKERTARSVRIQRAAQQNVGEILVHIARHQCAPMISQLTAPAYLARMLETAATSDSDVLQPVLKVAIALLSPRVSTQSMQPPPLALGLMPPYEQPVEQPSKADLQAIATEVVRFIPHLTNMLSCPSPMAVPSQELPYGTMKPPLGRQRITVIELGQALLATNESVALRAMLDSDFIPRAMDLFQQYPFNSILHSNVLDMLSTLIDALTPSHDSGDGQLVCQSVAHDGPIGSSSMPGQDSGEQLGGAAGGPPVVGGSMAEGQDFVPTLSPGFDFSSGGGARISTDVHDDSAADSSIGTGADAPIAEQETAEPEAGESVEEAAHVGEGSATTPTGASSTDGPPIDAEGDSDVVMGAPADDEEDCGPATGVEASVPLPPPPQRNIVRPGSIGGPSGAPSSGGPVMGVGLSSAPEGVAVAEGDESAVHSSAHKLMVPDAEASGLEEEDTEIGDDQVILECLLDKVNIIGWLLKLNASSEAERTFFQPSKDVKTPLRAAYHGHLTQLAARLQASKHGLLQATLDMNRDWQSFKTSYLDKQLHLEDRNSWEVELPTVQNGPDELTDPGSCQMDVYSQADFDNTESNTDLAGLTGGVSGEGWLSMGNDPPTSQSSASFMPGNQGLITQALDDVLESEYCELPLLQGDMFNGVPMAGRYTLDDDEDEYADADLGMFDDDPDGSRGMRGAADASGGPHSHTIDAGGGILSHEGDDAQLVAAVRAGGFGSSHMMGGGGDDSRGAGGLIDQMAGLGLGVMEAPAVDDDDEVLTGGQDDEPQLGLGLRMGLSGGPSGPHTHFSGHHTHQSSFSDDDYTRGEFASAPEDPPEEQASSRAEPALTGTELLELSGAAGGESGEDSAAAELGIASAPSHSSDDAPLSSSSSIPEAPPPGLPLAADADTGPVEQLSTGIPSAPAAAAAPEQPEEEAPAPAAAAAVGAVAGACTTEGGDAAPTDPPSEEPDAAATGGGNDGNSR